MPDHELRNHILDKGNEGLKRSVLESPDPHIRRYAVFLLGAERDPALITILAAALEDPDKGVRAQAAVSLGEMGAAAKGTLIQLLCNENWKVRYRAAESLGMIPGRHNNPALIKLLGDEKDHVRYMAAKSLGACGDVHALAPLVPCLQDRNEYVRNAAAKAIEQIRNS